MNCSSCRKPLAPGLIYFCRLCFFAIPGNERVALVRMHGRKQDCGSKVAKCVRILAERRAPKHEGQERVELPSGTPVTDLPTS